MRVSNERNATLLSSLREQPALDARKKLPKLDTEKLRHGPRDDAALVDLKKSRENSSSNYDIGDARKLYAKIKKKAFQAEEQKLKPKHEVDSAPDRPTNEPRIPDINGDGEVGEWDLKYLLKHWGEKESKADFNEDNIVDIRDLSHLLANWGKVPEPEPEPKPEPTPDIDGDGVISVKDVRYVIKNWDQRNTRFDFNNDGSVNFFDLSHMLNLFHEQQEGRKSEEV